MMKKWLTLHFYIVLLVADAMEANQCLQTKITQLVSVILLLYWGLNLFNITDMHVLYLVFHLSHKFVCLSSSANVKKMFSNAFAKPIIWVTSSLLWCLNRKWRLASGFFTFITNTHMNSSIILIQRCYNVQHISLKGPRNV